MHYWPPDPRVTFETEAPGRYHLDVREMLMTGGEPYAAIMACVRQLAPGEILYLHAIFEPVPLIRKLGRQGFALRSEHCGIDHWVLEIQRQLA